MGVMEEAVGVKGPTAERSGGCFLHGYKKKNQVGREGGLWRVRTTINAAGHTVGLGGGFARLLKHRRSSPISQLDVHLAPPQR